MLALGSVGLLGGCSLANQKSTPVDPSPVAASADQVSTPPRHLHIGQVRAVFLIEKQILIARIPGVEAPESGPIMVRDRKQQTLWFGQLLTTRTDRFLIASGEPPFPSTWQDVWLIRPE